MERSLRLPVGGMALVFLLLIGAAALHLKILSGPYEEAKRMRPRLGPRLPIHPKDPDMTESAPEYREMAEGVEELRALLSDPDAEDGAYRAALDRIRKNAVRLLYPLEELALDLGENPRVRCALLDVLADFHEEAMRQLFARLFIDPQEDPLVRIKALEKLVSYAGEDPYRDDTFRVLDSVYRWEPEFPERTRILSAIARTRTHRAFGLVEEAVRPGRPERYRLCAAEGLSHFGKHPAALRLLVRLARTETHPEVRARAMRSLALYPGKEPGAVLAAVAEDGREPSDIRSLARALLQGR